MTKTKICSKCKKRKLLKYFSIESARKDKLRSWCRRCDSERNCNFRQNNQKIIRKKDRLRYLKRKKEGYFIKHRKQTEKARLIRKRKNQIKYKLLARQVSWKMNKIKFTVQEFYDLLRQQDKCCAICKRRIRSISDLHLDHDHKTKKVRGLLCDTCNWGLGQFYDSTLLLKNAINYLKRK